MRNSHTRGIASEQHPIVLEVRTDADDSLNSELSLDATTLVSEGEEVGRRIEADQVAGRVVNVNTFTRIVFLTKVLLEVSIELRVALVKLFQFIFDTDVVVEVVRREATIVLLENLGEVTDDELS